MEDFEQTYKDWIAAFGDLADNLREFRFKKDVIEKVYVRLGKPESGMLPCRLWTSNGQEVRFTMTDTHPPFDSIRNWLERLCEYGSGDRKELESVRIDCDGYSITIATLQIGWIKVRESRGEAVGGPVSLVFAHESGMDRMQLICCCLINDFIEEFYDAFLNHFSMESVSFDDTSSWRCHRDWSRRTVTCQSETLQSWFRSGDIEATINASHN